MTSIKRPQHDSITLISIFFQKKKKKKKSDSTSLLIFRDIQLFGNLKLKLKYNECKFTHRIYMNSQQVTQMVWLSFLTWNWFLTTVILFTDNILIFAGFSLWNYRLWTICRFWGSPYRYLLSAIDTSKTVHKLFILFSTRLKPIFDGQKQVILNTHKMHRSNTRHKHYYHKENSKI